VTTYALEPESRAVLAVWGTGVGHRATALCRLAEGVPQPVAQELCEALTRLSEELWDTYLSPTSADQDTDEQELLRQERGEGLSNVLAAIGAPHLPDQRGLLLVSYDPMVEYAHTAGRALHGIGDPEVARAVAADVQAEINAVERAGRGDLSGRAAQAVSLDRVDVSPVQVAAADRILHDQPLGTAALWTSVDPAAACVAAAHWLAAAAEVAADLAGLAPPEVFGYADDIEAVSVEVPAHVVEAILGEHASSREVVTGLLVEAAAVREGRVPDPAALLARVDNALTEVRRIRVGQREQVLAALLARLTPLDPLRPARDLLEHLLSGARACLLVYREEAVSRATPDRVPPPDDADSDADDDVDEDELDEISTRVSEDFTAAVRHRAARDHARLTR